MKSELLSCGKSDSPQSQNVSCDANSDSLNASFASTAPHEELSNESKLPQLRPQQPVSTNTVRKRHRRTKKEIENSKRLEVELARQKLDSKFVDAYFQVSERTSVAAGFPAFNSIAQIAHRHRTAGKREIGSFAQSCINVNGKCYDDECMISVDSLSNYEKQIILNEFCEVCQDTT